MSVLRRFVVADRGFREQNVNREFLRLEEGRTGLLGMLEPLNRRAIYH